MGLTVADIERSIYFYRDILGMTMVGRRPRVNADYVAQQTGYPEVELNVASFKVTPNSRQGLEVVEYLNHTGKPAFRICVCSSTTFTLVIKHWPHRACASSLHPSPLPPAPTGAGWSPIYSTQTATSSNSSNPRSRVAHDGAGLKTGKRYRRRLKLGAIFGAYNDAYQASYITGQICGSSKCAV